MNLDSSLFYLMAEKDKKWRGRIFRYAPLILWTGMIFLASSDTGSMSSTSRFVRPLLEFLFPGASAETIAAYHGLVRKSAHFIEYAALAFWASLAFSNSGNNFLRRFWPAAALTLVLTVAIADEYNQSFNPARTGSAWDVAIDFAGGLAMISLYYAAKRLYRGRR